MHKAYLGCVAATAAVLLAAAPAMAQRGHGHGGGGAGVSAGGGGGGASMGGGGRSMGSMSGGARMGSGGPGPSIRGDAGPRGGNMQFSQRSGGNFSSMHRGDRRHGRHFRHRGSHFAFGFGGYPFYDDHYGAYAYADPACELVRVRHVRPNGRVVWRTVERCY